MKSINVELLPYTFGFQIMFCRVVGLHGDGSVAAWAHNTPLSAAALTFVFLEVKGWHGIVSAKRNYQKQG